MPLFRRRAADPAFDPIRAAFDATAVHVASAQRALLAAIPTSRDEGVPLAQAIAAFLRHIDEANASMATWKDERVVHEWTTCHEALTDARDEAHDLRLGSGDLEFEQLIGRVGDVLHHLEAFTDVEAALKRR